MKHYQLLSLTFGLCLPLAATAQQQTHQTEITSFKHVGPLTLKTPFMADSTNTQSKAFNAQQMMMKNVSTDLLKKVDHYTQPLILKGEDATSIHLAGCSFTNAAFGEATITVKGAKNMELFIDNKQISNPTTVQLSAATHQLVVKYQAEKDGNDTLKVTLAGSPSMQLQQQMDGKKSYSLMEVLHATQPSNVALSADGKYLITGYQQTAEGGKKSAHYTISDVKTGRIIEDTNEAFTWMPTSCRCYTIKDDGKGNSQLIVFNPTTGLRETLIQKLPSTVFQITPDEKSIIYNQDESKPELDRDVYEVVQPDDRIPGWRNRSNLMCYNIKDETTQPLTFGHSNISLSDISADSRSILFVKQTERLTQRPTTLYSLYKMDLNTLQTECLIQEDGFISNALFSPDGKSILLQGSPECLNGIGKKVKDGQTPSMIQTELYLMDAATHAVKPLTLNFNPNVQNVSWNRYDQKIYFTAEDQDSINLFCMDAKRGAIAQMELPEEMVMGFAAAQQAPLAVWWGESASNSYRIYTLNLKNQKSALREDVNKALLANVELGKCEAWSFKNSKGDIITGRYYLPPHFNPQEKYPMVVNYYGGCSPTSRNFESRYPQHAYAAQGYVVLVLNPSGCTGFGQEFSARHVNTAGQGVAEDIIEGVKAFNAEHPFVNSKKVGCIGASYGGFMTQYLQTQTDIFAAAISHAGISDHASYWGEGYWGYSYSEVSMANSYPWTNPDLYVKQSPLFNADKVHTPLLFLHGTADTNVPVGESIQMFNALKLLGRETAMVLVQGENHHILDYNKRIRWQNTIFAWFAKYLKDDATLWNSMYPNEAYQ